MNTWSELLELRRAGMKPSLPLVVMTDDFRPARVLIDEGCMVILHKAGEPFHVELLDGLRVMLFLRRCDRAAAVMRLIAAKGIKADVSTWCECSKSFERLPVRCEVAEEWLH